MGCLADRASQCFEQLKNSTTPEEEINSLNKIKDLFAEVVSEVSSSRALLPLPLRSSEAMLRGLGWSRPKPLSAVSSCKVM